MASSRAGRRRQPLELEVGDEARTEVILAADLIRDPAPARFVLENMSGLPILLRPQPMIRSEKKCVIIWAFRAISSFGCR